MVKRHLIVFVGLFLLSFWGDTLFAQNYEIPYLEHAPQIDGNIDSFEWGKAKKIDHLSLFDLHRIKAWGQDPRDNQIFLGYDEKNLYIGLKFAKRAQSVPETAQWQDDAVDIMLDAYNTFDYSWKYFQLVVSHGEIVFQRYWQPWCSGGGNWVRETRIASKNADVEYYETEIAIPFHEVCTEKVGPGHRVKFNVTRTWAGDVRKHWPFFHVTSSLSEKFARNCNVAGLCTLQLLPKGQDATSTAVVTTQAPAGAKLPGIRSRQFNFYLNARFMPTYDSIWIDELSIQNSEDLKKTNVIELSLLGADGRIQKLAELVPQEKYKGLSYSLLKVPQGKYTLTAYWRDSKGDVLGEDVFEFSKNTRPFLHSTIGLSKRILPPYKPLNVPKADEITTITTTYGYNALALPRTVHIRQEEPTVGEEVANVLSAPISFAVGLAGQKARAVSVLQKNPVVVEKQEDVVRLSGKSVAEGLIFQLDNRVEYDGLNLITLSLSPEKKAVSVDSLYLDIPLSSEQATLFHVIGDRNRFAVASAVAMKKGMVWNSLEMQNSCLYGNFKPMIWIGNEDRGLTWYADSDLGWSVDIKKPAQEVFRMDDSVHLRVHFISKQTLIDKPRTITFGLLATPAKILPPNWKSYEVTSAVKASNYYPGWSFYPALPNLRRFEMISTRPPLFDASYSRLPQSWDKARTFMDSVRQKVGGNVMRYCCVDLSGGEIAEEFRGEWSNGQQGNFSLPSADNKFFGEAADDPIKYTHWFINWRARSFQDYAAWSLDEYLKHTGNHAYYEDNQYIRTSHVDDPALLHFGELTSGNGGFRDEDGVYHRKALISELRNYNRRMATVYDENHMENLLASHKSTQMQVPALSFVTFAMDGEQKPIMKRSDGDYIDLFPLDYIRAHIMGRQFGVIPIWLDQIKTDDPGYRISRSFHALCLLHEITMWNCWMGSVDQGHMKLPQKIWRLKSEFNFLKPTEFYPYWSKGKKCAYKAENKKIVASCWKQADRALVVVVNLGEQGIFNIDLDMEKLCPKKKFTVKDWELGRILAQNTGHVQLSMRRHNFCILWIE